MKQTVKKITSLVLVLALSLVFLPLRADASAICEGGTAKISTTETDSGDKLICIITKGADVLAFRANNTSCGFITSEPEETSASPWIADERQVSDTFYMNVANFNSGKIVAKYKITLTGMVSRVNSNRYITSVEFNRLSGVVCEEIYEIDGHTAYVEVTHSEDESMWGYFILGTGGTFSVL